MSVGTPVVIVAAAPATPVIISGIAPNTALTIKVTSTAAFTVEDANGNQVLVVDTSGNNVQVEYQGTRNISLSSTNTGGVINVRDSTATAKITLDSRVTNSIRAYSGINTAGWGVPAIYASGRSTAQTGAVASIATYTVGAADGSFEVTAELEVTTSTTFSIQVQVSYTDPTNAAATLILGLYQNTGTALLTVTNTQGAGNYAGRMARIRCKAGTAITVATIGTFTTVTYNVEAMIAQVA